MKNQEQKKDDRAERQALAQIESIMEMVKALDTEDDSEREQAQQTIYEDPLEISIRGGWHRVGEQADDEEFKILLCTGGPAVRIIGELGQYSEPENVRVQYQDWFTAWEDYPMNDEQEAAVLTYAQQFYFGE